MKLREQRNEITMSLFPKDIVNKTFLFDDNVNFKKIRVCNGREDNERYSFKVIFEGHSRMLCLTKRALDDLLITTSKYSGVVKTVRFEGKAGECKGTHWLFSIVDDADDAQQSKPGFSILTAMGIKS